VPQYEPAKITITPHETHAGELCYIYVAELPDETHIGRCENGVDVSRTIERYRVKAGGYIEVVTEKIQEQPALF